MGQGTGSSCRVRSHSIAVAAAPNPIPAENNNPNIHAFTFTLSFRKKYRAIVNSTNTTSAAIPSLLVAASEIIVDQLVIWDFSCCPENQVKSGPNEFASLARGRRQLCGLTFELTCTLRRADFGLGFRARNWTAAKCQVERGVRPRVGARQQRFLLITGRAVLEG